MARHLVRVHGVRELVLLSRRGADAPGRVNSSSSWASWVPRSMWSRVMWRIVRRWPVCWRGGRCGVSCMPRVSWTTGSSAA
nr:hypothetical protein [Streptomyces chartreusis]